MPFTSARVCIGSSPLPAESTALAASGGCAIAYAVPCASAAMKLRIASGCSWTVELRATRTSSS